MFAVGCFFVSSSEAIYTWTDENGVKHFSDTEPGVESEYIGDVGGSEPSPGGSGGPGQTMKMPVNGECEDLYFLMDGVCVHPTVMDHDAMAMKAEIADFKRSGNPPASREPSGKPSTESSTEPSWDEVSDDLCQKSKQKLEKYLREGVMGINILTGKIEKMTGAQAEQAIANARDDVDVFCEE